MPMGQVIQIGEARIRDHLRGMVRGTVDEKLIAILDAGRTSRNRDIFDLRTKRAELQMKTPLRFRCFQKSCLFIRAANAGVQSWNLGIIRNNGAANVNTQQAKAALAPPGGAGSYRPEPCSWWQNASKALAAALARLARAGMTPIIAL